jgi:signal transduction histidine kinase
VLSRSPIDDLEPVLARLGDADHDLVEAAGRRARRLAHAGGGDAETARQAGVMFVAEVLAGLVVERELSAHQVASLVKRTARATGFPPESVALQLYREWLRALQLRALPPLVGIEAQLRVLAAFARADHVSLWIAGIDLRPFLVLSVGKGSPSRRVRAAARAVLSGSPEEAKSPRSLVHGLAVTRWNRPYAALVLRASPADRDRALAFAEEAASTLAPLIEKDLVLEQGTARERALLEASERRLTRLGFDIHDGPIQDLVALAADVRFFRDRLAQVFPVPGERLRPALDQLDELRARLVAVDRDLRELAHWLEPQSLLEQPFPELVRSQVEAFARRSQAAVVLDVRGDFADLTRSQRIALVRLVQEALTNARDHSGASEVRVTVSAGRESTEATIVDNGHGFSVERGLVSAAKRGRLGLVGMAERIRLLGGRLEIESRPGGPTSVRATIPRWQPLAVEAAAAEAKAG